jgi:RNase P/RNase MRP subunit p29
MLKPGTKIRIIGKNKKSLYGMEGTIVDRMTAMAIEPAHWNATVSSDYYFVVINTPEGVFIRHLRPNEVIEEEVWNSPLWKAMQEK